MDYISRSQAKPPTKKTLMSDLNKKYEQLKTKLKDQIYNAKYICLTADVWTNKSRSFLGVSVHYFDEKLDRQSYLLAFRRVYGRHTYAVLADMLLKIQKELNIKRLKITHMVTDGASNFKKAFIVFGPVESDDDEIRNVNIEQGNPSDEEEELEIEDALGPEVEEENTVYLPPDTIHKVLNLSHSNCNEDDESDSEEFSTLPKQMCYVAHSLNLLGTTDFDRNLKEKSTRAHSALANAYAKLKRFWEVNSRSTVAHEIVEKVCKRSFPYPNATRWNSKYDAISVAEKNRTTIKEAIDEINKEIKKNGRKKAKNLQQISNNEWKILKDYSSALRPLAIALDILQGDKRASQGYVLPTLFVIKANLEENIEDRIYVSEYGTIMNESILIGLQKRFGSIMKFCEENKDLILAAAIHPCSKLSWIEDERDREYAQTLLINSYIEFSNVENKTSSSPTNQSEISCSNSTENQFFKRLRQSERRTSNDDTLTFDVWKYLLQPTDDPNLDQIRINPILENLFRRYNTTLSSSAAIERIFSRALQIFTPRRNRISNLNFEKALFVQQNSKLLLN